MRFPARVGNMGTMLHRDGSSRDRPGAYRTALAMLVLIGLAIPSTTLAAQKSAPRWYDVEIIVFRNVSPPGLSDELWPTRPSMPDVQNAVSLKPFRSAGRPQPFSRLPSSGDRLDGVWKALKRSSRYQPILHIAWTQPGYSPANARAVRLHGKRTIQPPAPAGSAPPAEAAAVPGGGDATAQPRPSSGGSDAAAAPGPVYQLDGTVKLSVVRYLHLTVDMIYSQVVSGTGPSSPGGDGSGTSAAPQAGGAQPGGSGSTQQGSGALNATPGVGPRLVRFPMRQQRRMRSGKLHYLDNPRFGILALVTPRGS